MRRKLTTLMAGLMMMFVLAATVPAFADGKDNHSGKVEDKNKTKKPDNDKDKKKDAPKTGDKDSDSDSILEAMLKALGIHH